MKGRDQQFGESQVRRGFSRWHGQLGGQDSIRVFNEMLKPFGLWVIVEKILGEMWVKVEKKP